MARYVLNAFTFRDIHITNMERSSNMLYPKEDGNSKKLMFACRTCQFSEDAVSSCVFRNNLYNTVGETAGVTQDVGSDPTVSSLIFCTLCGDEIGRYLFEGERDNSLNATDMAEDEIWLQGLESEGKDEILWSDEDASYEGSNS